MRTADAAASPSQKILLIERDPDTAEKIRLAIVEEKGEFFELEWVRQLPEGLERLNKKAIAAVLLELALPDGIEPFDRLSAAALDVPVLILGGEESEALATEAMRRGALDYLLLSHLDSYTLPRALRRAIARKAVEDALHAEKERAIVTLNSIGDAVLCTDISGYITYLNLVAESMTGWSRDAAIGQPLAEVFRIIDGTIRKTARDPMEMAVAQNRTVGLTSNCVLLRRDGFESSIEDSAAPIHDRVGRIVGAVIVFHDVSVTRDMTRQMTHSAHHDVVTGLPNRLLLNDRISQSIALARRQNRLLAVLFLDLDAFKCINDSLGHAVGDLLLQSVSRRILASVRGSDTVSRQGGDEFVILLSEISDPKNAAVSARKILLSLNERHFINGSDLHIDGSIGISIYPEDGTDSETLIKSASIAMHHAKDRGRNNFQFFTPEMNRKAVERQSLESGIRRAVEREEFVLHYQPIVDLDTEEITGFEALIRWPQPDGTFIPPVQFVPIAEDCGLIVQIGRWVMREACRQARAWHGVGLPALPVAVNVSASEFRDPRFVESVRRVLSETGLEGRYLELELTEGVLMQNVKSTALVLQELKSMGVLLAVDDFGTGYSSLSYLRQFPIHVLKIDRSFISQITVNPDDSSIVSAIINMARSLKHLVVAEGIETEEQRAYLRTQHCPKGQGYLFSRPVPAAQFAVMLQTGIHSEVAHLSSASAAL
jgi:diguanylate cyclase (GGDEF)-like protein/PAS domain S-box-containing protein